MPTSGSRSGPTDWHSFLIRPDLFRTSLSTSGLTSEVLFRGNARVQLLDPINDDRHSGQRRCRGGARCLLEHQESLAVRRYIVRTQIVASCRRTADISFVQYSNWLPRYERRASDLKADCGQLIVAIEIEELIAFARPGGPCAALNRYLPASRLDVWERSDEYFKPAGFVLLIREPVAVGRDFCGKLLRWRLQQRYGWLTSAIERRREQIDRCERSDAARHARAEEDETRPVRGDRGGELRAVVGGQAFDRASSVRRLKIHVWIAAAARR